MGQQLVCPLAVSVPPPPIVANTIGTWAYNNINCRLPAILRTVLATFATDQSKLVEMLGDGGQETLEMIQSDLEMLLDNLTNNLALTPLTGRLDDVQTWNTELEEQTKQGLLPHWHDATWLFAECYLYRKIYDIVDEYHVPNTYDYFLDQKANSFNGSIEAVYSLAESILTDVLVSGQLAPVQIKFYFMQYLLMSLWGNQFDLTLSGGSEVAVKESPLAKVGELASFVVVDQNHRIFTHLDALRRAKKKIRIDFVLDNAGFELFTDMCLADMLTAFGLANRVTFHVKAMPWFVSDTTSNDILWLLERMRNEKAAPSLQTLAARWRQHFSTECWDITTSSFWTSPFPFAEMARRCPHLYWRLQGTDLILFKGDLNYRKLLANRPWPINTSFCRALDGFHPAPLASLRILKADVMVGMTLKGAKDLTKVNADWMTSNKYALIQMCRHMTPIDLL